MQIRCFFLCFQLWIACGLSLQAQNEKLVNTKMSYGGIAIGIPPSFQLMDDEDYQRKYVAYLSPIAKYTSSDATADLIVNVSVNRALGPIDDDLKVMKKDAPIENYEIMASIYKTTILNSHNQVEFLQEGIQTIQKRRYIVFEFVGTVKDLNSQGEYYGSSSLSQYYYLQYALKGGEVFIFNFTCKAADMSRWQEVAKQIMNQIKID